MSARVRDAAPADAEGVARVHVQGRRETSGDFPARDALAGLSVEERIGMWRQAFARPDPLAKFLVAEAADGEVVGTHGPTDRKPCPARWPTTPSDSRRPMPRRLTSSSR